MHVLASIWEGRTNCVVFVRKRFLCCMHEDRRIGNFTGAEPPNFDFRFSFVNIFGKPGHEDEHQQQLSVNKKKKKVGVGWGGGVDKRSRLFFNFTKDTNQINWHTLLGYNYDDAGQRGLSHHQLSIDMLIKYLR